MRWILVLTFLAANIDRPSPSLPVRLYKAPQVSATVVAAGLDVAARILVRAGVTPIWIDCTDPDQEPRCGTPPARAEAIVRIVPKPLTAGMEETCGHAFAAAPARQSQFATIYADCVTRTAKLYGVLPGVVFGHALAHEIGHLLLGATHAPFGIMRAYFDQQSMDLAVRGTLHFTPPERATIQYVLIGRRTVVTSAR